MKAKWIAATVLSVCAAVPVLGQIGVYIGPTPPPLRYEVRPPVPGPEYVWTDGYWNWVSGRYVWVPGRWVRPPYPGAFWTHPHYDHYDRGWQFREGHWDREDHGDHFDGRRR